VNPRLRATAGGRGLWQRRPVAGGRKKPAPEQ